MLVRLPVGLVYRIAEAEWDAYITRVESMSLDVVEEAHVNAVREYIVGSLKRATPKAALGTQRTDVDESANAFAVLGLDVRRGVRRVVDQLEIDDNSRKEAAKVTSTVAATSAVLSTTGGSGTLSGSGSHVLKRESTQRRWTSWHTIQAGPTHWQ